MSSLNKVMIIGRLGRDPEMRYTQAGKPVCSLNVATDEGYTNDRGEKVDKTEWHKVVFWDRQAETCSQYLAKGSLVFVEGRLSTRKYPGSAGAGPLRHRDSGAARPVPRPQGGRRRAAGPTGEADARHRGRHSADYEDLGPAFPSEASGLDDVPF